MRKAKTYKEFITTGTYRREEVTIKFSKSGCDQEWSVRFNNGRLLTNEVHTNWNKPTYLRTQEGCKTLEDVLTFLYTYSFAKHFVKIVSVRDWENKISKSILDFDINLNKLQGTVYFGRYEIIFNHNEFDCFVTYIGHLSMKVNDGTFLVRGKRDLLRRTNEIVGRLASSMEFLQALKKIEQVEVMA